jgi:transcription initiation factor TFIIIB Brf1 subunit/transcription initiation factor TFIIB
MGAISIRSCPSCKCFTLQRDYMAEVQLYVCRTCGFAVNEWNLNTGSAYNPPVTYSTYTAPKKPKPTSFKRTKTKKPTKKQLEELSATIDNQLEI